MDQKLVSYRYSSCCCFSCSSCWGNALQEKRWLRRFKSDRDEIWKDCFSSKHTVHIDWRSRISDVTS